MFSGYGTFSLFDPIPQERNHLKYHPVTKILSRIFNLSNAAIWHCIQMLARSPQYIWAN
jgi:hypothetical protein